MLQEGRARAVGPTNLASIGKFRRVLGVCDDSVFSIVRPEFWGISILADRTFR